MTFIVFDSYAIQNQDHTLTPISMDDFYTMTPTNDQTFAFTATISEDNYDDYIQFTPTGMDITVKLNDTEVYRSHSSLPEDSIDQITSRVPIRGMTLPITIVMECTHLGSANTIFPPMLFTTSDMCKILPNLAWGHRGDISTGVFAVVFLVLFALFLYSIIVQRPRYSIIPLLIASVILMIRSICAERGYLFLPEWMITLFTKPELLWILLIAYISYLACHYKRIKLIRYCSLGSISIFIGAYLISLFTNGHFSRFVNDSMNALLLSQDYTTTLLWMNILLQFICLLVAGITTMTSISKNFFIFLSLPFKIILF